MGSAASVQTSSGQEQEASTAVVGRVSTVCDEYGRKDRSNGEKEGQVSARRPTRKGEVQDGGGRRGRRRGREDREGRKVVAGKQGKEVSSAAGALADRLVVRTLGQNAVDVDGGGRKDSRTMRR